MIAGDPAQIAAAAADLRRAGTAMDDAADVVGTHARDVTAYWSGAASERALETMTALASAARTGGEVFTETEPLLTHYAAELRAAQDDYAQGEGLRDAGEMTLRVLDHGLPPEALTPGTDLATAQTRISTGSAMMAEAVIRAEDAAQAAATAVDALTERLSALPAPHSTRGGSSAWARLRHDATEAVTFGRDFVDGAADSLLETGRFARDLLADEEGARVGLVTGLVHAAANPIETVKAVADLETLEEEGAGYWLGGFAPGAAATATGLGGAAWLARSTTLSGPSLPGGDDRSPALEDARGDDAPEADDALEAEAPEDAAAGSAPVPQDLLDSWGKIERLDGHVEDHGPDFGTTDTATYFRLAVTYRDEMLAGDHPMTVDKYGNMRSYDLQTNTFAAYDADGTKKTFFKPDEDQIEKYSNPFKGLS